MCSDADKILIIHPEGNFHNNPNLFGIIEVFLERGLSVDYVCEPQSWNTTLPELAGLQVFKMRCGRVCETFGTRLESTDYKIVFGIDLGVLDAAAVSRKYETPLAYISYEIFFESEAGASRKKAEIEACSTVRFAVVQDEIRARCLSEENNIPMEKMIFIPVAYRGIPERKQSFYVHDALNIPRDKKIALFMGAITERGMVSSILHSMQQCPDDWALVLHDRYGKGLDLGTLANEAKARVFISNLQFDDFRSSANLLCGVDVGLAFYKPLYTSVWDGKNIEHIGMSGGKISAYLQQGVPIVINEIEPMSEYVQQYHLGAVCQDFNRLWNDIQYAHANGLSSSCQGFFDSHLNLDRMIEPLMDALMRVIFPTGQGARLASDCADDDEVLPRDPVPDISASPVGIPGGLLESSEKRVISFREYIARQQGQ